MTVRLWWREFLLFDNVLLSTAAIPKGVLQYEFRVSLLSDSSPSTVPTIPGECQIIFFQLCYFVTIGSYDLLDPFTIMLLCFVFAFDSLSRTQMQYKKHPPKSFAAFCYY